jgi:hypothetical protein
VIFLNQVKDRNTPFLLDIGIATQDRRFVEIDRDDAWISHEIHLAGDFLGASIVNPSD